MTGIVIFTGWDCDIHRMEEDEDGWEGDKYQKVRLLESIAENRRFSDIENLVIAFEKRSQSNVCFS